MHMLSPKTLYFVSHGPGPGLSSGWPRQQALLTVDWLEPQASLKSSEDWLDRPLEGSLLFPSQGRRTDGLGRLKLAAQAGCVEEGFGCHEGEGRQADLAVTALHRVLWLVLLPSLGKRKAWRMGLL